MKKKAASTVLLLLLTLTAAAQERLIRVDSKDESRQRNDLQTTLNNKEKARLLMPQSAVFGMECIPSFSPEWTLTYDSTSHMLVYKIAKKSIWQATYLATHKLKKINEKSNKWVSRKRPKDYVAPGVQTFSLAISEEQAQTLREIWTIATVNAVDREVAILDGTKWEYFINGRRAKTHSNKVTLVKFTNELAEAVKTGNKCRRDSLFSESQKVIISLTTPAQPEVLEPGTVRRLIVVNGVPLTDADGYVSDLGADDLVYFNQRQQSIHSVSFLRDEENKQAYAERYGVKVKEMIVDYTTEPDRHSDSYVRDHPELMQTLHRVEGFVVDEDGNPWAGAWVYVQGKSRMGDGTATDSTGHFAFWISPTDKTLSASHGLNYVDNVTITDQPTVIRMRRHHKRAQ